MKQDGDKQTTARWPKITSFYQALYPTCQNKVDSIHQIPAVRVQLLSDGLRFIIIRIIEREFRVWCLSPRCSSH